jgi:hypothetical protein
VRARLGDKLSIDEAALGTDAVGVLPTLLGELYPHDPERASTLAARLAQSERSLIPRTDVDATRRRNMTADVDGLEVIGGGVDWPMPASSKPSRFDRACVTTIPGRPERIGLRITDDCTCGQRRACRARASTGTHRIEIERRVDATSGGVCLDCYASWTTCTIPHLEPSTTYRVAADGADVGSLTTSASGFPAIGSCVEKPP